jgi:phosphoserine phosphatase RsbU/P
VDSRERGYLQQVGALRALAAQAAVVIDNARLYREVVERERTAQELRIAAHIQQALLPPPLHSGVSATLAAKSTPCRDVGGDFFDYTERPDGGLAFVVGDVAGKGTSAALLTAVIQGLFAAEAETDDDPSVVVTRVNRALCRRAIEARFVTAFYAQLDVGGSLKYCNAGHNAPFLLSPSGVRRLETGGTVLGLFDKVMFETGAISVASGDVLVVFSDGVTEAVNPAEEELGDEGLAACLRSVRLDEPSVVLDAIERTVRVFCGPAAARDDITVMVVRVK